MSDEQTPYNPMEASLIGKKLIDTVNGTNSCETKNLTLSSSWNHSATLNCSSPSSSLISSFDNFFNSHTGTCVSQTLPDKNAFHSALENFQKNSDNLSISQALKKLEEDAQNTLALKEKPNIVMLQNSLTIGWVCSNQESARTIAKLTNAKVRTIRNGEGYLVSFPSNFLKEEVKTKLQQYFKDIIEQKNSQTNTYKKN